jgi:CO/xanthine dehydrogenase Mo-binding subunit
VDPSTPTYTTSRDVPTVPGAMPSRSAVSSSLRSARKRSTTTLRWRAGRARSAGARAKRVATSSSKPGDWTIRSLGLRRRITSMAAVEIDPVDLVPRVVRYLAVEDCGHLICPDIVDGQIRGGVAMGIGEVLHEAHVYAPDGQLETCTLRDYLVPLTTTVPPIEIRHHESPTPATPLGTKGVGEAGTIGAFGAVPNAVADALTTLGVELTELPLTPERIFTAMRRPPA